MWDENQRQKSYIIATTDDIVIEYYTFMSIKIFPWTHFQN